METHVKKGLGSVVLGNFKHRRRQNAALMLGVMLSIFFLSASVFGVSTMLASGDAYRARSHGRQNLIFWETGGADLSSLITEGYVSELAAEEALYTSLGDPDLTDDDFNIARYTPELDSMRCFSLLQGRLPEREGEIAVELGALMRLRQSSEPGSTLSLVLETYDGAYAMPETVEKTFTLVGVLRNKDCYDTSWTDDPMIPLWRLSEALVCAEEQPVPGSRPMISTLGVYVGPMGEYGDPALDAWEEKHISLAPEHSGYFRWDYDWQSGSLSSRLFTGDTDSLVLLVCVVFVFLALTAASMIAIASMLTSNIEKRSTQIGMLRAIGATRRQIRRLLLRETLLIALTTLPVGVALAAGAIFLLGRLYPQAVVCSIPGWILAADIAACFVCVCLSSLLPLRRSMRITPMQAVRDIEKTRLFLQLGWKSKARFTPAKLLARRNNALRRGRTRALTALVAAGCLFFCAIVWFSALCTDMVVNNTIDHQFALYNYNRSGGWFLNDYNNVGGHILSQDKRDIESIPYVQRVECSMSFAAALLLDDVSDYITAGGKESAYSYFKPEISGTERFLIDTGFYDDSSYTIDGMNHETAAALRAQDDYESYLKAKEQLGFDADLDALSVEVVALSDQYLADLAQYVTDGEIDREKLDRGEQVLILAPREYAYRLERTGESSYWADPVYGSEIRPEHGEVYQNDTFFAGDPIEFQVSFLQGPGEYRNVRLTKQIGAVLSEEASIDFIGHLSRFSIVTSLRGAERMALDGAYTMFRVYTADFPDEDTHEAVAAQIEAVAMRNTATNFSDYVAKELEDRRIVRIYITACVLLFVLLLAFSFGMLSGAVAGKIRSDVHQIGTMRAAGASKHAVFSGYAWQLYRMFLWGGAIGWLMSLLFVWARWKTAHSAFLRWGWVHAAAAPAYCALLLGLCLVSVRLKLRPIFKNSVVENIRVL